MEKHVYRGPRSLKILQWQPCYNVQLHFRLAQNLATRQMDLDSQLKTFVIPRYDNKFNQARGGGGTRGWGVIGETIFFGIKGKKKG